MKWFPLAGVMTLASGLVWAGQDARVLSDRVNLRARPVEGAEVVGQVNQGDMLAVLNLEGDWVEVQAPTNAGVWIKGEFIRDGVVKADKVNVRSGPGVSYRAVGVLRSGQAVQVRETRGDWTSIVPPEGVTAWIRKELLERPGQSSPASAEGGGVVTSRVETGQAGPCQESGVGTAALPQGVSADTLAPVLGQGAVIERQGTVERVPMAIFRGVEYRLVADVEGRKTTVAYVRGRDEEMAGLVGRQVRIRGRGWWLSGERWPLMYADAVQPVKSE